MTAAAPPAPQTAAQRQAKYRESQRSKGFVRLTLVVSESTAKLLRDLSRDHNAPMTHVLELGTLVAQRELTALASQE